MKKIIIIVGCLLIVFGVVACGIYQSNQRDDIYLVLVNKENPLPDNWSEKIQLVEANNCYGEAFQVEQEALNAFILLHANLIKDGDIDIELDSTYRSIEEQQEIWDDWLNDPELGEEYCKQYLAVPGYSEHHTGLAIDVFLYKDGEPIRDNDDMIAEKDTFAKIHAKLAEYGFILRYPEGKEDITGYNYEPWHFRYVGDPKIANEIMEKGITLEEYLSKTASFGASILWAFPRLLKELWSSELI